MPPFIYADVSPIIEWSKSMVSDREFGIRNPLDLVIALMASKASNARRPLVYGLFFRN